MKRNDLSHASLLVLYALLFCLMGCSTHHTAALDGARTSVAQARANTLVATNAPVTLHQAELSVLTQDIPELLLAEDPLSAHQVLIQRGLI